MKALRNVTFVLAMVVGSGTAAVAVEDETPAHMLQTGAWLCTSPDAYDRRMAGSGATGDEPVQCQSISQDLLEDMMAPFVRVEETNGDHVLVNFVIEDYNRIELLHGSVTHLRYRGWTAADNLRNYYEWLTGQPQD
jgi:hypothetical protein